MKRTVFIIGIILGVVIMSLKAQVVNIDVNANVKHSKGNESSFERQKFITHHTSHTESAWNDVEDKMEYLLNDLDTYFGRETGAITWQLNQIEQDPSRQGYADSSKILTRGQNVKNSYQARTWRHQYESRSDLVIGAQVHPFWIDGQRTNPASGVGWALASPTATGEYIGRYVNSYFGDNGQPRPKWVEIMNEPLYDLVTQGDGSVMPIDVFKFHSEAAAAIREQNSEVKIGGYTTAFPDFEKNDFKRWDDRMKLFIDSAGEDMDFYSIHLYDFPIFLGKERYRRGSNVEATLDMLEHYSQLKHGEVKEIMISEYGAQLHDLFNKPWTPYRDWLCLKSFSSMMMSFMERPDVILKSIPFTPLKAEWGRISSTVPYYWRLMRRASEGEGETGNKWVWTDQVKFYQLWSDVKGTRVDSKSLDVDIQVDSYVNGNVMYIIADNLSKEAKSLKFNVEEESGTTITQIKVKHLFLNVDRPILDTTVYSVIPEQFEIAGEGTMILAYTFSADIATNRTSEEVKYYAKSYLKEIIEGQELTFVIDNVLTGTNGEAVLRLGLGRDHGKSLRPLLTVNGERVSVPANFRGLEQGQRDTFFGVIEIPVPHDLIQNSNEIKVKFNDDGGHISSLALQYFNFSHEITRTAGDAVTGVELTPESKTTAIGFKIQLLEQVKPATAENLNVIWSSSDDGIATVDEFGIVTGVGVGEAVITVTTLDGDFKATSIISVLNELPDEVSCELIPELIESGSDYVFKVPYTASASRTIVIDMREDENVWQGGAEIVVEQGSGVLDMPFVMTRAPKAGGDVQVTVYIKPVGAPWQQQTDVCLVEEIPVKPDDDTLVTGVTLEDEKVTLQENETLQLQAVVSPSNATNPSLIWSSDDESIAKVANGLVTAISVGEAIIKVITVDGDFEDSIEILVEKTSGPTSLNDNGAPTVFIFPNPAESVFYIRGLDSQKNYELSLIDLTGKVLIKEESSNRDHFEMNVDGLADGVYQLLVFDGAHFDFKQVHIGKSSK